MLHLFDREWRVALVVVAATLCVPAAAAAQGQLVWDTSGGDGQWVCQMMQPCTASDTCEGSACEPAPPYADMFCNENDGGPIIFCLVPGGMETACPGELTDDLLPNGVKVCVPMGGSVCGSVLPVDPVSTCFATGSTNDWDHGDCDGDGVFNQCDMDPCNPAIAEDGCADAGVPGASDGGVSSGDGGSQPLDAGSRPGPMAEPTVTPRGAGGCSVATDARADLAAIALALVLVAARTRRRRRGPR